MAWSLPRINPLGKIMGDKYSRNNGDEDFVDRIFMVDGYEFEGWDINERFNSEQIKQLEKLKVGEKTKLYFGDKEDKKLFPTGITKRTI